MNNVALWKNYGKSEKTQRYQFVKTDRKINCLVSEPNFHTTKFFTEKLLYSNSNKENWSAYE